jgi:enamine deaminase RidA (YjgF/YER057c/UK114 family)
MRSYTLDWLGWEFVGLSCEARRGVTAREQALEAFEQSRQELKKHGLTLNDTVRTRLWSKNRESRDESSAVRVEVLSGSARAASSSFTAPDHFFTDALVRYDILAVKPRPGIKKAIRENEPPRVPIRYMTLGPLLFLSGQTAVLPTLEMQVTTDILPRITEYLAEAKSGWGRVAQVSCYLNRSQSPEELHRLFRKMVPTEPPRFEIVTYAEGYSPERKLVEIEVTALRDD